MESQLDEIKNWESRYQSGDTPWEKGYAAPPLMDFLVREILHGKVFVPGCGVGHDVRALSRKGAEVIGLDFAPSAIQRAQSFTAVGRETYIEGDLFHLQGHYKNSFDWVFEHTCFCAIQVRQRPEYVRIIHGVLKDSGLLLAIFFMNPDLEGKEGPPFPATKDELNTLFAPCFELQKEWVPTTGYPGREGRELMRLLRKKSTG